MVRTLCTSGNHELLKFGFHGTFGVIAALMAAYNGAAWCLRREDHLAINTVVYSLAVGFEVKQTLHHLNRVIGAPRAADVDVDLIRKCA